MALQLQCPPTALRPTWGVPARAGPTFYSHSVQFQLEDFAKKHWKQSKPYRDQVCHTAWRHTTQCHHGMAPHPVKHSSCIWATHSSPAGHPHPHTHCRVCCQFVCFSWASEQLFGSNGLCPYLWAQTGHAWFYMTRFRWVRIQTAKQMWTCVPVCVPVCARRMTSTVRGRVCVDTRVRTCLLRCARGARRLLSNFGQRSRSNLKQRKLSPEECIPFHRCPG